MFRRSALNITVRWKRLSGSSGVVKSHTRKKRLRNEEKFKDLPTEDVIHDVPEEERICPACGSEMVAVGKDYIRTEVQYVPAKLKVIRHYQMVYECRNCRKNGISNHVKAGLPKPLIDHSFVLYRQLYTLTVCSIQRKKSMQKSETTSKSGKNSESGIKSRRCSEISLRG